MFACERAGGGGGVQFTYRPVEGPLQPFPWQPPSSGHALVSFAGQQTICCHFFLTMEKLYFDQSAFKAVEDYWEYRRFVSALHCAFITLTSDFS